MAKQEGLIQLTGSIGNMSFYKTKNGGFSARKKAGVSASRIATDPNYALLRANGKEFGQAGRASKLIRTAFLPLMKNLADGAVTQRLTALCKAIIKTDTVNEPGSRLLTGGQMGMFENFEFNIVSPLDTSFFAPYSHLFDRTAGSATISIPAFIPDQMVQASNNATHFRLRAGAAAINFDAARFVSAQAQTEPLQLDGNETAPVTLTMPLPTGTADALFLTLSIEFLQQDGEHTNELRNSMYSAMRLIAADVQS